MNTFPVPVIDLPFLAHEINDAHRQVAFHGKSMLLEARRAGEHLLRAKEQVKHGEFKAWIERNCVCSYPRAAKYMQVAKLSKNIDPDTFDGGIDAFLEAHATPRPKTPSDTPTFDRADAEYVLKLHSMAVRGATENERSVARNKLGTFAHRFGMGADDVVARSEQLCPDHGKTSEQVEADAHRAEVAALRRQIEVIQARIQGLKTECSELSRAELEGLYIGLVLEREGLTKINRNAI